MSARKFSLWHPKKYGNVRTILRPMLVRDRPAVVAIAQLHRTEVFRFLAETSEVRLDSGGWRTVTTKTAMNTALYQACVRLNVTRNTYVFQRAHEWYVQTVRGEFPFFDGMYVNLRTGRVRPGG